MRPLGPPQKAEAPRSPRQFLERVRAAVEDRLREVLDQVGGDIATAAPNAVPMFEAARDLTLRGGKQIGRAHV